MALAAGQPGVGSTRNAETAIKHSQRVQNPSKIDLQFTARSLRRQVGSARPNCGGDSVRPAYRRGAR